MAVILSQFPCYDETFLLRELVALEREGVPFVIYSLKSCRDRVVHDDAARLAQRTIYAPLSSPAVWAALVRQIAAAPIAVASVKWRLIRYFWRHPIVLAKSLIVFTKAIYFGHLAQASGVRLVHAGWATYPATAAWAIQRLYGLPYSFAAHAHDIYLDTTMLAEKIRAARWVVTCTEENAHYLARLANGGGNTRVVVNHHGLDLSRFSREKGDMTRGQAPWGREPGTGDKGQGTKREGGWKKEDGGVAPPSSLPPPPSAVPLVLSVGSLLARKGFEELIEACRLLRQQGVAFRCVIAGGGPLETHLRQQIAQAGLTDVVTLLGYISQEALVPWYRQASVFVLAAIRGLHFGLPNVFIEALAAGVPVICTPLPAVRELLGQAQGDAPAGERLGDKGQGTRDEYLVPNRPSQLSRPQRARAPVMSPTGPANRPVPGYEVAECGLVVPDRDAAALAAAIERLLRDRALADRLVAVGQKRVWQGWDIRVTGPQLAALLLDRAET